MIHGSHHLGSHNVRSGDTDEDVGILQGVGKSSGLIIQVGHFGHFLLHPVQPLGILGDDTYLITHDDVGETVGQKQLGNSHTGASGTVYYHAAVFLFLADHFQGIDDTGEDDDSSTVLVVMEYGDVKDLLQAFLNLEAAGGADVFQIDAAEAGSQIGHGLDDLFGVLSIQTDGYGIHVAEFFEENCLAFHNGHGCIGADVTQTQNRASVGDNGYGVGFHGVFVGSFLVLGDYFAGLRNTGSISNSQILTGLDGSLGHGLQFTVPFFMHQ